MSRATHPGWAGTPVRRYPIAFSDVIFFHSSSTSVILHYFGSIFYVFNSFLLGLVCSLDTKLCCDSGHKGLMPGVRTRSAR